MDGYFPRLPFVATLTSLLHFEKHRGDEGLAALERFLDLTHEEWMARRSAMLNVLWLQNMFVNGQQLQVVDGLGMEKVVLHLEQKRVEMQMLEPGRRGLILALQRAMLFHPAFGPQPDEEGGRTSQGPPPLLW